MPLIKTVRPKKHPPPVHHRATCIAEFYFESRHDRGHVAYLEAQKKARELRAQYPKSKGYFVVRRPRAWSEHVVRLYENWNRGIE